MKARKTVSVCMAVYNGADYLGTQLTSILGQLFDEDEVVIVNDGSTDRSHSLIENIGDSRIRLLDQPANRGAKYAFEKALSEAKGDIIFFSDQDDVWLPGKVSRVLEAFDQTGAFVVVTDAVVIGPQEEVLYDSFFSFRNSGPGLLKNFYKNTFMGCCMAVRGDCKSFLLPFPRSAISHDIWVGLACESVGQTYFLPEKLLLYRRHGRNHSPMKRYAWGKVIRIRLSSMIMLLQGIPRFLTWKARKIFS